MEIPMAPMSIYRGQWKSLRLYTPDPKEDSVDPEENILAHKGTRRSILGIFIVYIVPLSAGIAAYVLRLQLNFGDTLIAVMGILAGALIATFSQLANWRQIFKADKGLGTSAERWLLDSSIAHILAGAYSAVLVSIITLIAMAVQLPALPCLSPWIHRVGSVVIVLLSAHVAVSILMALPNLYSAYVQINDVIPLLNGRDKTC
ncbi:hypothetical protein [Bifidobacterium sp. M0353]|uniref:hypothetical protein n=1 Tax=Bifidobacterium sp. M0353 TaxID=2751006 RepID=UPI0018DD8A64|nr:hypothetical protein [Bifidobacterium sp. M0353]MBI0151255.1 hypothetical protein [Bifidobacterium sp. M0353]